jgi:hypothetical protein
MISLSGRVARTPNNSMHGCQSRHMKVKRESKIKVDGHKREEEKKGRREEERRRREKEEKREKKRENRKRKSGFFFL